MELCDLTIIEAHKGLINKKFSSRELTQSCLSRIEKLEDKLNAFITVTADEALDQADKVDKLIAKDEKIPPLAGIPGTVKDLFSTKGVRTTCASKILENYVPPYDATVIKRLKKAGFVMLGKTNMDEFAQGSSGENSAFGPTKNPWDLTRVPGGTSSGSAAAVVSGMGLFSQATDTGGSIRQPASFCGVVGLKPTYGRVSRYGVVPYGSSLDCPGLFAKSVQDVATLLGIIAGKDPFDSTTVDVPIPNYKKNLNKNINGLKMGLPKEYFGEGINPEVKNVIHKAVEQFEELGAEVDTTSLPSTDYAVATYYILVKSEVSANLARYDGIRFGFTSSVARDTFEQYHETRGCGFGPEVKRGIMLGAYSLSAGYYDQYYLKAQRVRTLLKMEFEKVFEMFDVLITPVSPFPAFKVGEKVDDPLQMYLADVYTVAANSSGIPGISINAGFSNGGLPIGIQILGPQFQEEKILQVAHAYQQATDWHKKKPKLISELVD